MPKMIHVKIYTFFALVSLALVSSYSRAVESDEVRLIVRQTLAAQERDIQHQRRDEKRKAKRTKLVILGTAWTLAFSIPTIKNLLFNDSDCAPEAAKIGLASVVGGSLFTLYNALRLAKNK